MIPQNAKAILAAVESLDYRRRWRYMIALGRQSITDQGLAQVLETLAQSNLQYERLLALMSTYGSHHVNLIARLLCDPSSALVSRTLRLAVRVVPDATLVALMPNLAKPDRHKLAYLLFRAGRTQVNDTVYSALGTVARRRLLPLTSESLDAEQIAALRISQWAMLTQRLPVLIRDLLVEELVASRQSSYQIRVAVSTALRRMLRKAPSIGLTLLKQAAERMPPHCLPFAEYASFFPSEVAAILEANRSKPVKPISIRTLRRLDIPTLLAFVEADALPNLLDVFPKLLANQRVALYQAKGEAWREASGALPLTYAQALPSMVRQAEARHVFSLSLFTSTPMARLPYLACLPRQEALALAQPFLSHADSTLRAQAISALILSARYDAGSLNDILDLCVAHQNEQDRVRLEMIRALAKLPTSRWTLPHLKRIETFIDAVLQARDSAYLTMDATVQWLIGMMVRHTSFVVEILPRVVERMGSFSAQCWESCMSDRDMARLAPHVLPLIDTWIAHEHFDEALTLIFSFGRRARAVPQIVERLLLLTQDSRADMALAGLNALQRIQATDKVAEQIPRLIEQDSSWIGIDKIARHLHLHRQDLLTPFLSARVYRGLFPSDKRAYLPTFEAGFIRWTSAQQQRYAKFLYKTLLSNRWNAWDCGNAPTF